jgi:hypothetical protein
MCSYPRIAILVPRFFDLFAYEVILGGKKFNVSDMLLLNQKIDADIALRPVIDLYTFANKSGLLSETFDRAFESVVSPKL